jgi:hypothetical protein
MSKITRAKWTGEVAQVVEYEALSSNPSPTKKKKERNQNKQRKKTTWKVSLIIFL